ncbi:MAG: universal stress protein [Rhodospirillales bacterium]|nr:universal stress protein [Rhodospirillales bacterium]
MFKNILLAVDGSETAQHAAEQGISLAKRLGAQVTIVTVTLPWDAYFSREVAVVVPDVVIPQAEYEQKRETIAAEVMRRVWTEARSAGLSAVAKHRCHRDPYQAIIDAALENGCDLIVAGSHCDRGLAGGLPGSETMKIVTHTTMPVLVYRQT